MLTEAKAVAADPASSTTPLNFATAADSASDSGLWSDLVKATDPQLFARSWLPITARTLPAIRQAVVLLEPQTGVPLAPLARWAATSAESDLERLTEGGQKSLDAAMLEKRSVIDRGEGGICYATHPFLIDDAVRGAVVVEANIADALGGTRLLRHLQWSSAWVEAFVRRGETRSSEDFSRRASAIGDVVNAVLSQTGFRTSAQALAEYMANALDCSRAAIGRRKRHATEVVAFSQTAGSDGRSEIARAFAQAMDEAIDQEAILVAPIGGGADRLIAHAQQALLSRAGGVAALSIPLMDRDAPFGALTLIRQDRPFTESDIDLADALVAAAAPVIVERYSHDRSLLGLLLARGRRTVASLVGADHVGLKIVLAVLILAGCVGWFARDTYNVVARGQVHGEIRRVMSAPFDGFLKAQHVRAGQIVKVDDLLAELQDNDLALQRLRQIAQRQQYQLEHDRALAKRDLAQVNIARAQVEQASAEIDLSDQMLGRTQIRAPFDAVVVSGDLSQSTGKPVARGDTLFELAPLDRYRVTLVVSESDIGVIRPGAGGRMLLTALPEDALPIEIISITPVARVADGINGFEVLANLKASDPRIRPSMEGTAKIEAGEARLIWIWTHAMTQWLRVRLWPWLP